MFTFGYKTECGREDCRGLALFPTALPAASARVNVKLAVQPSAIVSGLAISPCLKRTFFASEFVLSAPLSMRHAARDGSRK